MCFAFSPLPLKSSLCQIIVIFNIFLHIYHNEKNLIIGIVLVVRVQVNRKEKFVDAKRVVGSHILKKGSQAMQWPNEKGQNDKQWSTKNYTEN